MRAPEHKPEHAAYQALAAAAVTAAGVLGVQAAAVILRAVQRRVKAVTVRAM